MSPAKKAKKKHVYRRKPGVKPRTPKPKLSLKEHSTSPTELMKWSQTRWDPRRDIVRLRRSVGMTLEVTAHRSNMTVLQAKHHGTCLQTEPLPTFEQRMAATPEDSPQRRLTALLAIQTLMVLGHPIPRPLRQYENLAAVTVRRAMKIRATISASNQTFAQAEYFVVMELAPGLMNSELVEDWMMSQLLE